MSFTPQNEYTEMMEYLIKGHLPLLSRINQEFDIPDGAQAGAITVDVLTGITATTVSDGTMLSNGAANVLTALTYVQSVAPVSLLPGQFRSSLRNPRSVQRYLNAGADAIAQAAMNSIVAGMIAATPGSSDTLPVGNVDFKNDGTIGDIISNLNVIGARIGYLRSVKSNATDEEFYALTTPTGYGNLYAIAGSNQIGSFLQRGGPSGLLFGGIPVYSVTGPSNWGAATKAAMYIAHRSAYALKFDGVFMHGGDWIAASDGTYKGIFLGPYAHGSVMPDLLAEILNPAS